MRKCWLFNKNVIITGASGGIGFTLAKILIEKYNCTVYALARNFDKLNQLKLSFNQQLDKFIPIKFDVTKTQNWDELRDYFINNDLKLDILINNAGFMLPFTKFENLSKNEIDEILLTNLYSVIYGVKTFMPLLKKSSTPTIVNVSSSAGNCAVIGESLYCTTKFAVKGFTQTLQQEYKKKIAVIGVYPGFIKTNILHKMHVKDKENKLIQKLMLPLEKAGKKIIKGIKKKKKSVIMGIDGRSMSFFVRMFPNFTPSLVAKFLKASKLALFDEVFDQDN